jgi:hypothetical protein
LTERSILSRNNIVPNASKLCRSATSSASRALTLTEDLTTQYLPAALALCPPPSAQAADRFVKMGNKIECGVMGPFMTVLDFAENIALKYEQATYYLICQEE